MASRAKLNFYRQVGNVKTIDGHDFADSGGDLVEIDWKRGVREITKIGQRHGFPIIPQNRVYHRYLIDGHANEAGHENMALDIADFLESWEPFTKEFADGYSSSLIAP